MIGINIGLSVRAEPRKYSSALQTLNILRLRLSHILWWPFPKVPLLPM